jgi:hypothetical protein
VNPATHLLIGWAVANTTALERRDRAIVTLAGIAPDIDGLGILVDFARDDGRLDWWWALHHTLAHNLTAALVYSLIAFGIARRRLATATLAFVAYHLHLLGDLVGSRAPDGYPYPIPYLNPWNDAVALTWSGQWELNAWPNLLITAGLLAWTFRFAWRRGRSPLEIVSPRADRAFTLALRRRFGQARRQPEVHERA